MRHDATGDCFLSAARVAHEAMARYATLCALIGIGLLAAARLCMRTSGAMRGVNVCVIGAAAGR
eukprot:6205073-Pleurochrysis_carterae.AAC.2